MFSVRVSQLERCAFDLLVFCGSSCDVAADNLIQPALIIFISLTIPVQRSFVPWCDCVLMYTGMLTDVSYLLLSRQSAKQFRLWVGMTLGCLCQVIFLPHPGVNDLQLLKHCRTSTHSLSDSTCLHQGQGNAMSRDPSKAQHSFEKWLLLICFSGTRQNHNWQTYGLHKFRGRRVYCKIVQIFLPFATITVFVCLSVCKRCALRQNGGRQAYGSHRSRIETWGVKISVGSIFRPRTSTLNPQNEAYD